MIVVKIKSESGKVEVGVPAIIDSDGHITITKTMAFAAAHALQYEEFPETVKAMPLLTKVKRK